MPLESYTSLLFSSFFPRLLPENRAENGAPGSGGGGTSGVGERQRPRLASVPSRAEDAVDQLQENEKLIAGKLSKKLSKSLFNPLALSGLCRTE